MFVLKGTPAVSVTQMYAMLVIITVVVFVVGCYFSFLLNVSFSTTCLLPILLRSTWRRLRSYHHVRLEVLESVCMCVCVCLEAQCVHIHTYKHIYVDCHFLNHFYLLYFFGVA